MVKSNWDNSRGQSWLRFISHIRFIVLFCSFFLVFSSHVIWLPLSDSLFPLIVHIYAGAVWSLDVLEFFEMNFRSVFLFAVATTEIGVVEKALQCIRSFDLHTNQEVNKLKEWKKNKRSENLFALTSWEIRNNGIDAHCPMTWKLIQRSIFLILSF